MIWNKFRSFFQKSVALPSVRGKLTQEEPLAKKTWFGVGGKAQVYFEPADKEDLIFFLQNMPALPITVLGAGSNVLIRDGGVPGVTIRLGNAFRYTQVKADKIICGGYALLMEVSKVAEKNCLSGLEFFCGIPGTIGGGIKMNAGAYGQDLQGCLEEVTIVTTRGEVQVLHQEEIQNSFSYRNCFFPQDWIIIEAVLKGVKEKDNLAIKEKMIANKKKREATQPQGVRTAGSTFKNPTGVPAWKLIENAGMRGATQGGALVSEKHANFLINTGTASASDIETLGENIRKRVQEKEGVLLEWEVKRIGVAKK